MADSHVVSGLRAKKAEVLRAIADYEDKIKAARAALVTLNEALAIFGEFTGNPKRYFERHQIFERGELFRIIFDALRDAPAGLMTTELAAIAIKAKDIPAHDTELQKRVARSISTALNDYARDGRIVSHGFHGRVRVWRRAT